MITLLDILGLMAAIAFIPASATVFARVVDHGVGSLFDALGRDDVRRRAEKAVREHPAEAKRYRAVEAWN